ncbi:hypothetical protein ACJRO7_033557 [Eucalyptus globulus]|uniref:Uncharacterized protein n=1 Tax=Eucalyptus globulus TaxID=34317 RepID=A0ABD3JQR8_EUCGL
MVQVLKHIDPTTSAHRLRLISTMMVSTPCRRGSSWKATPLVTPELDAISAEIKNSLFCSKTEEPKVGAQNDKDTSLPGTTFVVLPSCDDDTLAVENYSTGKHICDKKFLER